MTKRSFSLVEMMVTVAIFGVVSALAMQSFGPWSKRTEVYNAGSELASKLQLCRRLAADYGRPCSLGLSVDDSAMTGGVGVYYMEVLATHTTGELASADTCWDALPVDGTGTCGVDWVDGPRSEMGVVDYSGWLAGDPRNVSLLGWGGESNTAALSWWFMDCGNAIDGGSPPGWPRDLSGHISPNKIVYGPNGRLMNPESDFDCDGNINVWIGNVDTKDFVEVQVNRTGKVTWADQESAHHNPFTERNWGDTSKNECGS